MIGQQRPFYLISLNKTQSSSLTKAYVRSPIISIGGGKEGFDGLTVGLQGFDNPYRDQETNKIMTQLQSQCCKLQMDSDGFVEIQKVADTEAEFRILGNFF